MPPPTIQNQANTSNYVSSTRRHSSRQVRSNITRPTNYYARPIGSRNASMGGNEQMAAGAAEPEFFPAITHFTDSVAALPKDIIKHFSMLKEVEAKIFAPEQEVKLLFEKILQMPIPSRSDRERYTNSVGEGTLPNSTNGSVNGSLIAESQLTQETFSRGILALQTSEQAENRRLTFLNLRKIIHAMIPALEEKVVVLTSANKTLNKGLARMESSHSHISSEISEEARCGSTTHWAYADKEEKKKPGTGNERTRREVASANNLVAAAAVAHENEINSTRSEARREAMVAKRGRHQLGESDFDDMRPSKKPTTHRSRKPGEAMVASSSVGLGISTGSAPTAKRRNKEKAALPAISADRNIMGVTSHPTKANAASPRETPLADASKKKAKQAPPSSRKKPNLTNGQSPHMATSPLVTSVINRDNAPAPLRPQSSRARQDSSSSMQDNTRFRPQSSASNHAMPGNTPLQDLEEVAAGPRHQAEKDSQPPIVQKEMPDAQAAGGPSVKREDTDFTAQEASQSAVAMVTRGGRVSKAATPVTANFPTDIPMVRTSSRRNHSNTINGGGNGNNILPGNGAKDGPNGGSHTPSETGASTVPLSAPNPPAKRSHKKGASTSNVVLAASTTSAGPPTTSRRRAATPSGPAAPPAPSPRQHGPAAARPPDEDASSMAADEEEEVLSDDEAGEDGDEPRYCYCDGVSYGDMVACDNKQCPREWFHLECVGMQKPPPTKSKWFCDDCKENMKKSRPASRQ